MGKIWQHQKDINGCGIACIANLLDVPYYDVKKDFESKFCSTERSTKIFDIVSYLKIYKREYKSKFFNQNVKYELDRESADKFSRIPGSIILIKKNAKYPLGHYLLRTQNGWVDPWYDFPCIDNVTAGIRKKLPGDPWYVLYPVNEGISNAVDACRENLESFPPALL